jgi:hypothetical protein
MHPSPHILERVRLQKFDANNKQYPRLAELGEQAHPLATGENETVKEKLQRLEMETDGSVAALPGTGNMELGDIQSSLADLK